MGTKITIKQNDFSHGMQSDTRNQNLVGQTEVFGAEKLKHFDIYKNGKLQPQPSFERFNTDAEKDLEISVVGGKEGTTLYGLGKGLSNWYGTQWDYRIRINASQTSTEADYVFVDLSQLGDDFWDNVNADGSDVRITTVSGNDQNNRTFLKDFDNIAKTGCIITDIYEVDDLYVYFGNPNATAISDTVINGEAYNGYNDFFNEDLWSAWTFNDTIEDFQAEYDLDVGTDRYTLGKFNYALGDATLSTSISSTNQQSIGDEASISFLFKMDANPTSIAAQIFAFSNGSLRMDILTDGKIRILTDTVDDGNVTTDSATSLTTGEWHYISVNYDKNDGTYLSVYVDGAEFISKLTISGNLDDNFDPIQVNLDSGMYMQNLTHLRNDSKEADQRVAEGLMHSSGTFWTEQTIETYSSITTEYEGVGIYKKELDGSAWEEATYNGQVIKEITDRFIMPAFIDVDTEGGFFFLSGVFESLAGSSYGGRAGFDQKLIEVESTLLSSRKSETPMVTYTMASDKEHYMTNSKGGLDVYAGFEKSFVYTDLLGVENQTDYSIGFTGEVYDAFPLLTSLTKYGYSLAMTGTREGRSSVEIWDLINLDPNTVIDFGTGNSKVIANIKGNLINVVDNYIQSPELSRGKPSLDFRAWVGQDNIKTLQSFQFDNVDTTYDNDWQFTIDNRRSDLHNSSIFYAEPMADYVGLWGIGAGEKTSQLGVSIVFDTSDIGYALSHHSIGNNLIYINNNYEMYKLNDDGAYTQTSEFTSMNIDAGLPHIKKEIKAIEVTLDKEPAGQTVTVSYKVDDDNYITIGTCTDKTTEFTVDTNEENFDSFNEMQLKIESTGGDATVVEYAIKVEYDEEVV